MIGRLRDLIAVNRAIVSSLDYEEVLRLIVDKTVAFTHADACVLLLTGADELARIVASHGIDAPRAEQFVASFDERLGESLGPLFDLREGDDLVAVPVMARNRVRGALVVFRRGPEVKRRTTDVEENSLMQALADQAAIALEHASQFREVRQLSEQKSRLLEAIQSNTTTYLAYLDRELRFREANAAYCEAIGLSPAEVIGRSYVEVNPGAELTRTLLQRVCETGLPAELQETPLTTRRDRPVSAEIVYWDWSARPVIGERGEVQGVVISAVDVTQKVLTRSELERSNERKDEFLAMLAHELRNPLAAISTAVEVLRRCGSTEPRAVNSVDAAARQVSHMRRLLDDLLDVSRITSGRIELRREVTDLGEVITQAVQLSTPLIRARRHALSLGIAPEPLYVEGDADRLVQVLSNLLINAAKYTDEGGHIELRAEPDEGEARIRVRDDGAGISPEALPHIFDLFVQVDRSLDRSQGGLGVGLTIVKRLVQMHGGRIEARSAGPGRGSEFSIWLPVCSVSPSLPSDPGPKVTPPSGGLRILLAEDNVDLAEMLSSMLELDGHEVTFVGDGEAAVDTAKRERPDVVLLDIGLPKLSGYEVAARLQAELSGQRPVIIALTGYGRDEDQRRALAAGIDHHLVKPVDPDRLRQLLSTFG
ncbi:MAG: ATP-binding protein [Enhygromyxa sp.]